MVSVCIVTYNHARYIKQCIESVLRQQTSISWELILADNSSTDGTAEICRQYAAKYPSQIQYVNTDRNNLIVINGNVTGRRNILNAISASTGKYIAILEGDDYWLAADKLERQVKFLESHPDFSMCCSNVQLVDEASAPSGQQPSPGRELCSIEDLAERNFVYTASTLYRAQPIRNAVESELFKVVPTGDYFLHMCCAAEGKIRNEADQLAAYRMHAQGIWVARSVVFQRLNVVQTIWTLFHQLTGDAKVQDVLVTTVVHHLDFVFHQPDFDAEDIGKKFDRKDFVQGLVRLRKYFAGEFRQDMREREVKNMFSAVVPAQPNKPSGGFFSRFRK